MRSLYVLSLAALAALGAPRSAWPQPLASSAVTLAGCEWSLLGTFPKLVPQALATTPDGALLLAGDDFTDPARPAALILRSADEGATWQRVDRLLPSGASGAGARALHVDQAGNAYLLAWVQRPTTTDLVLRRSFAAGSAGSWEAAEQRWPLGTGGALTTDAEGRVYVTYGFAGPDGIGWRVESALRGIGAFRLEDEYRPEPRNLYGALPQDLEIGPGGELIVAGQLDGQPDRWVVRAREQRRRGRERWRTLDEMTLGPSSYGLAPRAVVSLGNGRLLVAGLGTPGTGAEDYRWLERWRQRNGKWTTSEYQRTPSRHAFAHDAIATRSGVAVLGVGQSSGGTLLLLRTSEDGGASWQTALELAGVTNPWTARVTAHRASLFVTAVLEGAGAVLGCR